MERVGSFFVYLGVMLLIQSEVDSSITIGLLAGIDYTVGRKDCTIVVQNDQSISRKHAVLHVQHPEKNLTDPQKCPTLIIEDLSKYGTSVNEKKIDQKKTVVNAGDIVSFGILGSRWRIKHVPFVVTTSCLDSNIKKLAKDWTLKLGGHLLLEWTANCTHLIMSKLTVTVKAVCALISLKHIVTPEFLKDWIEASESGNQAPNPQRYLPPLAETCLKEGNISFTPDAKRKSVFQDKTFIFLLKKQFKKLGQVIELGGGKSVLMTTKIEDDVLTTPNTCVMTFSTDLNSQPSYLVQATNVIEILKKFNKRTIPECEIGLAVIYCSTDRYCNPDVDAAMDSLNIPHIGSQSLNSELYVADTESFSMKTIPSTITEPQVKSQTLSQTTGESLGFKEPFPISKLSQSASLQCKKRLRDSEVLTENLEKSSKFIKTEPSDSPELGTLPVISVKQEKVDDSLPKKTAFDWSADLTETEMIKTETVPDNYQENTNCSFQLNGTNDLKSINSQKIDLDSMSNSNKIKFENEFSELRKDTDLFLNNLLPRNSLSTNASCDSKKRPRNKSDSEEECEDIQRKLKKLSTNESDLPATAEHPKPSSSSIKTQQNNITLSSEHDADQSLVLIEVVSLIKSPPKKKTTSYNSTNSQTKNFKKFKKVQNSFLNQLPKIIGGQDLILYTSNNSREFFNESLLPFISAISYHSIAIHQMLILMFSLHNRVSDKLLTLSKVGGDVLEPVSIGHSAGCTAANDHVACSLCLVFMSSSRPGLELHNGASFNCEFNVVEIASFQASGQPAEEEDLFNFESRPSGRRRR